MEQNQNPQRIVRPYEERDLAAMREIWNEVVRDGAAFPQIDELADDDEAKKFFDSQTVTVVVESEGRLLGLYILHPNNVGRCGHIANSSYAVASAARGMHLGGGSCARFPRSCSRPGVSRASVQRGGGEQCLRAAFVRKNRVQAA